jgi:Ca-activated chloride channel family protein
MLNVAFVLAFNIQHSTFNIEHSTFLVPLMTRHFITFLLCLLALPASAQTVRITDKPTGLAHGTLYVPIVAQAPVTRLALFINNTKYTEAEGTTLTAQVNLGEYIRRLRMRAVGYDGEGNIVGEDEMVVNDPRPPFRVRLVAPPALPESGSVSLQANVIAPADVKVASVDFFAAEEKLSTTFVAPYAATFDVTKHADLLYARVVARAEDGSEANDVFFFGSNPRASVDVSLQQIPVSVASGNATLRAEDLRLLDDGEPRKIESLIPASDQPLHVILLLDYSESMLEELPVVKAAAKQFARSLLRSQDRLAVVGFNQRTFWLTGYTNDFDRAADAVDRVKPRGQTHLYESVIEMLYELQKVPGRRALVVLTDGVDQGSAFKLDHLVHYARYAGVPVYPIVKNTMLSRLMRLGVGAIQARKLAGIARETGATYFIIRSERELPGIYARIAAELRQQYQLLFYSPQADVDQWRALKLESKGGQRLRIPRGYFP